MKNQFKKLSLIFLLLISIQRLQAQNEKTSPPKVPEMLQNADYVFEGTVIDTKGYWTKLENGNNEIYTSLLVQVTNVFKGNSMKLGLVQIIVKGGWALEQTPNSNREEFHNYNPIDGEQRTLITDKGVRGVFAGKVVPNNMGYNWNRKLENNNLTEQQTAIIYCESCEPKYYAPWAGDFGNAKDLRKSIRSFNLQTDFIDRTDIVEDSIAKIQLEKDIKAQQDANVQMSKTVEEAKAREALMIKGKELATQQANSKKKANPNLKLATGGNLNFDLRNIAYSTVSGQNYVDFDVYMWGTQATYFDGTLVRLNFDKQAFGDSAYVKSYLTTAKGTSFNNYNYKIYGPYYISDTVIAINLSTNDSLVRPNRISVGTTPLQLMHVKFKIKSCQATAKMKFVDPIICDILTGYKLNSNDSIAGTVYAYDNIFRTDYSPIPLCPTPKITGFSPSVIRAGTNEVLTITGTNFGVIRGNGRVLFPNSDSIGSYLSGCDVVDYVSWTNTEIKVKVPSILFDSLTIKGTAGSGKFKVINNLELRDSTTSDLDVQYALLNSRANGSSIKQRINMAYDNCSNAARVFKLGQSLQPYPRAITLIDSALNIWAKFLNVDIRLHKNDTLGNQYFADNNVQQDAESMIYVKNFISTSKTLMVTNNNLVACVRILSRSEDIGINMSTNVIWNYYPSSSKLINESDFYQAILHEIGHALGLAHVINPVVNNAFLANDGYGELMHPYNASAPKTAMQRTTLETGRQMAKTGSVNIRDTSKTINWSCVPAVQKIREFTSPSNVKVCQNSSATFNVYVEQLAGSSTPTYQWQFHNGNGTWQNVGLLTASPYNLFISNASPSSFSITSVTNAVNNFYFRCVVGGIDGCSINSQVAKLTITQGPIITTQPINTSTTTVSTTAKTFSITASGNVTYQWYKGTKIIPSAALTNVAPYSGVTTNTLTITGTTGLPIGITSYFCVVTDVATGCSTKSNVATLTIRAPRRMSAPVTIPIKANPLIFNIYPNPANNNLSIQLNNRNDATVYLKLLNSNGFEILNKQYNNDEIQLDVSNIPSGLYIIQLNDGNTISNKEIIITH